jgi:hypothetical protein
MKMASQLYDTDYVGIKVRVDADTSPMFVAMVKEALNKIHSKPIGKILIDTIVNDGIANFGYKVCITRPLMELQEVEGTTFIGEGNLAKRIREDLACNGTGTQTQVKYNQNTIYTPDGSRPNFIGLAHELIHAMHNLHGDASANTQTEEHRTVGIGLFAGEAISENTIRAEHGVPLRIAYTGV